MVLVDTNVILDIWDKDPNWANWSIHQLNRLYLTEQLRINTIIYAELSGSFAIPSDLDIRLSSLKLGVEYIPREAAFLAGKAFVKYRQQGGTRTNVLADFFIGGHAEAAACPLLTRDARRYVTYFPTVRLITP
jgi:predicted nucleic acid-binding protein